MAPTGENFCKEILTASSPKHLPCLPWRCTACSSLAPETIKQCRMWKTAGAQRPQNVCFAWKAAVLPGVLRHVSRLSPLHKFCRRWKLSSCAETVQVHRCFMEIACKLLAMGHRAEQRNKTIYPRTYRLSKYWRELPSSESFLWFRSVKVPFWASDCCLQTILSAELFHWRQEAFCSITLVC